MITVVNGFDVPGCLKAAAAIEADLLQLTRDLTEAQFHAPPQTGGWSVGYCIEHLVLAGQAFLPKWDRALREAALRESRAERFCYQWWQRKILHYAEDCSKAKQKTPTQFVPCSRRSIEETVSRFLGMHQEFVKRVVSTGGLDLRRTKVQSPFVSSLWYALGFSFDLALAHERRHLCQAWRVRRRFTSSEAVSLPLTSVHKGET